MSADAWSGLAMAVSRDRALLGPEAAALLARVIDLVERTHRSRDQIALSPQLTHIRDVLRSVARSTSSGPADPAFQAYCGHADPQADDESAGSLHDGIGTREAAEMLHVSDRQVRRLATGGRLGPVVTVRGAIKLSRSEVAAYAAERQMIA